MIRREKTSMYTTFNVLLSFNPLLESGVMGILLRLECLLEVFWLKGWIQAAAAAISNLGLFEAEMSSDAFQLLGMSEIGMLPAFFAQRSKYGTPTISILCSATGVVFLSWIMLSRDHRVSEFLVRVRNASVNLLP